MEKSLRWAAFAVIAVVIIWAYATDNYYAILGLAVLELLILAWGWVRKQGEEKPAR